MTTLSTPESSTAKDNRWRLLAATMQRHQYQSDALIEVLHKAQELFGYLSDDLLQSVARSLDLPLSTVYGVATFYHFFSLRAEGDHRCTVCFGTACYVKGAGQLLAVIEQHLGIQSGHTTADGEISLATARCLGACGIAPVVVLDNDMAGHQTPEVVVQRLVNCLQETVTDDAP
ncbi:MAG: bidirectional hydrogenase complex protein HoxE [Phormidesmis sp. RL_2_1]|nr:bidirectional hydrogenase complex protein HoxE [Phormidesmis sp. RL_2_1]